MLCNDMEERYTDKLARYILIASGILLVFFVCRLFRKVLIYMLCAAVVALIGHPLMVQLRRVRIFKKQLPSWLCSIFTILLVISVFLGVIFLVAPVFTGIASDVSKANLSGISLADPLEKLNSYLKGAFPSLGTDFRVEDHAIKRLSSLLNFSMFSNVLSGMASFLASFGVGLFSVIFISFFFVKDPGLFPNIIAAVIPDRYESKARESMSEIGALVSRYFSGIALEVLGVTLLNFLGLQFIARLGLKYSIGIAFLTGILNVIPYVGPLIGEVLGTVLAVVIKYACSGNIGLDVSALAFALIVLAILVCTQLVDNFVYQPVIYSSSIKAHPLEIFIVLLLGGTLGGMLGILVAVPSYTVLRVVAVKFFGDAKIVRRLVGNG